MHDRRFLTRFAWLSIVAACLTIGLKAAAFVLTGSVGLLSDALESIVNLVAAIMALAASPLPPESLRKSTPTGMRRWSTSHPGPRAD